jgi:lysophospholipase L1-like esterase
MPVPKLRRVCAAIVVALTLTVAASTAPAGSVASTAPTTPTAPCAGPHWIGAWTASMGYVNEAGFAASTLRMIVTPHTGGRRARVRLTNPLVDHEVTVSQVYLGRSAGGGAALEPGSNRPVRFGKHVQVTIPAHGQVVSDPVWLPFEPFERLAVSVYVAAPTGSVSEHFDGHQLSWIAPGPFAGDETGAPFVVPTFRWTLLGGIDVYAPRGARSVVTLGDSITDGFQDAANEVRTMGANQRYPDYLARRLLRAGHDDVSVLNAGISGNKVLSDADSGEGTLLGYGPSALHRLGRDVLAQPGVSHVIVMEGTNDLGQSPPQPASAIIDGLRTIVRRVHAAGLPVELGTLPPRTDVDAAGVRTLNRVNAWIRTQKIADGVIDFHAVLRDPSDHNALDPRFDSGDGLHPNSDGYRAMASAVKLWRLTTPSCGA